MPSLNLNWVPESNANTTGQRALKRQRSVGGAFTSTDFTPANDLAVNVNSATANSLLGNTVYEFQVANICSDDSLVYNANGIQEGIKFECVPPTETHTNNTISASVSGLPSDITKVEFVLKNSAGTTTVQGPTTSVTLAGAATKEFTGLTSGTSYQLQVSLFAIVNGTEIKSSIPCSITATTGASVSLVWIANTFACEKSNKFGVAKTISGLSSPGRLWYDPIQNRMYGADYDSNKGNVFWFNPVTATSATHFTHSTKINNPNMYSHYIDETNRKIYFAGKDSGGLIVYNVDTDSITTVPFGTNGTNFSRFILSGKGPNIYCSDTVADTIVIISKSSLTVTSTIPVANIPNSTRFLVGGYQIENVGNEMWVGAGSGADGTGDIGVYNLTFTSNITNIPLSNVTQFANGYYWQHIFHDTISGNVYVSDFGSSQTFVINAATKQVLATRQRISSQGKAFASVDWSVNPITNELYAAYNGIDNPTDTASIPKMYIENRTNYQYKEMIQHVYYTNLKAVPGTNTVVGTRAGNLAWSNIPSALTDGVMTFLDSSISGSNTGNQIVLTLKQVDQNAANAPTGLVKNNTQGDPDYIPVFQNTTACPVVYTTACPSAETITAIENGVEYEISILDSVKNNPAVKKIQVFAYDVGSAGVEGSPFEYVAPFNTNYFAGSVSVLGDPNDYTIQVRYLDANDAVLATC